MTPSVKVEIINYVLTEAAYGYSILEFVGLTFWGTYRSIIIMIILFFFLNNIFVIITFILEKNIYFFYYRIFIDGIYIYKYTIDKQLPI